jgi:DnaJ-class molecular chaperone
MIPCTSCESESGWVRGIRNGRTYSYVCKNCEGKGQVKPKQSILPGLESAVEANHLAAAALSAEELTAEFKKPLGSVDAKTARMEMNAPLFFGQIHPTLF